MDFIPPKKIKITSDDSEVEFVKIVPKTNPVLYEYKWVVGLNKVGTATQWTEQYIKQQLSNYFKIIL